MKNQEIKQSIEAQIAEYKNQKEQATARVHMLDGAIQALELLLAKHAVSKPEVVTDQSEE